MLHGHNHGIENEVMAILQDLKKIEPCPQLPRFDYFPYHDRPTGWLTASDKINGWARMRMIF